MTLIWAFWRHDMMPLMRRAHGFRRLFIHFHSSPYRRHYYATQAAIGVESIAFKVRAFIKHTPFSYYHFERGYTFSMSIELSWAMRHFRLSFPAFLPKRWYDSYMTVSIMFERPLFDFILFSRYSYALDALHCLYLRVLLMRATLFHILPARAANYLAAFSTSI